MLGGQVSINYVPSGDDLVQFRRTAAGATVTPSTAASLSQDLLGVLPVPAGATPWSTNTNALMSLVSFVQSTYFKSAWTEEEALDIRRGFVAAVVRGWTIADGSRQLIRLLAQAGYIWAFPALTASPGARDHYDRRRDAGDRHAAAQRNLFSRLLGCLHHCLATSQHYDETTAFPAKAAQPAAA